MSTTCIREIRRTAGFTVLEMLVGVFLLGVLFLAVSRTFFDTTRRAHDHSVVTHTEESARTLLDFIGYDIRMSGAGMPLGQAAFTTTDLSLGDAPLPILTTVSGSSITLRINETGKNTVLTSDYTPSSSNLTMSVMSTEDLTVGDQIYISDMVRGGAEALRGYVDAKTSSTVTIRSDYVVSPAASFSAGSILTRISDVVYDSPDDWSGITRDNGDGTVTLATNSRFGITYLDGDGNELALPLTAAVIVDQLAAVELQVRVQSRQPLKSGEYYVADARQRIALRNVNLNK